MSSHGAERFSRKIAEVVDFARGFGIDVRDAVPLRSTNNVVIHLSPAPVIAKIGVSAHAQLRLEIDVAVELSALGAPVGAPAPGIPAVVHSCGGTDVTFWAFHAHESQTDLAPVRLAAGLQTLHAALARLTPGLRACLPSFERELDRVGALLVDPASLPALAPEGKQLLARVFKRLHCKFRALAPSTSHVVIHGAPHSYNVLQVNGDPLFIDFETTCTGPRECDLAYVESPAESAYAAPFNATLLELCRTMGSVTTAAFCWADPDRGDHREHAEMHLEHVRRHIAPTLGA